MLATNGLDPLNRASWIRFRPPLLKLPTKNTRTNSKVLFQSGLGDNYLSLVGNNLALWVRSKAMRKGGDSVILNGLTKTCPPLQGLGKLLSLVCDYALLGGRVMFWFTDDYQMEKQLPLCDEWGDTFCSKRKGGNKSIKQNKKSTHDHNKKTTSLTSKASIINISKQHVENTEL